VIQRSCVLAFTSLHVDMTSGSARGLPVGAQVLEDRAVGQRQQEHPIKKKEKKDTLKTLYFLCKNRSPHIVRGLPVRPQVVEDRAIGE
jgi:hypothetical protein